MLRKRQHRVFFWFDVPEIDSMSLRFPRRASNDAGVSLMAALLLMGCLPARGETLRLFDGTSVPGRILSTSGDEVLLRQGFVKRTIPKVFFARPGDTALKDGRAAFDRKDYLAACDPVRQILLWDPGNAAAGSLLRQARREWIRGYLGRFPRDRFYGEGMLPLIDIATTDDLPVVHEVLNARTRLRNRSPSAFLLGWLKSEDSVEPLVQALKAWPEAEGRMHAAYALGEIGSSKAGPALVTTLMTDPDPTVRRRAGEALNKLTPPMTAVIRKASQSDKDRGVREEMACLLDNPRYQRNDLPSLRPGEVSVGHMAGTRYLVYVPRNYSPRVQTRMLISVHGTDGSAAAYEGVCHADAERYGLILLAPYFDHGRNPQFGRLNVGLGPLRPDVRLLEIVDELARHLNFDRNKLLVFGHSQGGQFVHRFGAAHPHRIWRAAACASNNFAMPESDHPFPFGMGCSNWTPDLADLDAARMVQVPTAIVVGTKDEQFRQDASKAFVDAARAYAEKHKVPCKVVYIAVPDGPHAGVSNWPASREFLFADLPRR